MVRRSAVVLVLWAVLPLVAGCEESVCEVVEGLPGGPLSAESPPPSYLGLGDSILAMNGLLCLGVAGCASLELGAYVEDHSVGGQRLTDPRDEVDIMHQYTHGVWEWVIMDGGGMDLVEECGCKSEGHDPEVCRAVLDSLAVPSDRTGDIVDFIEMVGADTNDTASILIVGYYEFPEISGEGRDNCNPYAVELNLRYQQVAGQFDNVFLLETADVMDFDVHPEYFTIDHDHPSYEGSAVMGRMVADFIQGQVPGCTDDDGDGYGDPASDACTYPDRDCDDSKPEVNPGATEQCLNGVDDDCDGLVDAEDDDCHECTVAGDCDDGNACTDDDCIGFACVYTDNAGPCDDQDPCTMNDTCSGGMCTGVPLDADGDTYVADACGGDDCDDSKPEVNPGATEQCLNGVDDDCDGLVDVEDDDCHECTVAEDCDDGNACTDDDCVGFACVHTDNAGPCDDQDPCTMNDTCSGGMCSGVPLDADGDTYVADACGGDDCDDSNPGVNPEATEQCLNGRDDDCDGLVDVEDDDCHECTVAGDCDDGNACTDDDCVGFACVHTDNAGPCDDQDPCTMDDTCSGGMCTGVPLDADGDTYVADACGGDDCDDSDPDVSPGAAEGPAGDPTCGDGWDNDCDGQVDLDDPGCT